MTSYALLLSYVKHLAVSCAEGWHFSAFHLNSAFYLFAEKILKVRHKDRQARQHSKPVGIEVVPVIG